MISSNTETLLKRSVPLAAFTLAAWFTYKKRENIQESILFGGIVALIAYLALGPLIKGVASLSKRPTAGNVQLSNLPSGWSPEAITRELFDSIEGISWFGHAGSADLYNRVQSLNDDQLVSVYNHWRSNFFSQHEETLTQAMAAENYGVMGTTYELTKNIMRRLKARNCY